jgi:hypothetical protein
MSMDVNFKLAGNGKANALVASLQLRARKIRDALDVDNTGA